MSEQELFILIGILAQNFTIVDLVSFFEENEKLHI
jgi:hypothetical protein